MSKMIVGVHSSFVSRAGRSHRRFPNLDLRIPEDFREAPRTGARAGALLSLAAAAVAIVMLAVALVH